MRHQVQDNTPIGSPYNLPKKIGNVLLGKNASASFLIDNGSYPSIITKSSNQLDSGKIFNGGAVIITKFEPPVQDPLEAWRESTSLGPVQMRRALRESNLKEAVDVFVSAQSLDIQEDWQVTTSFKRLDSMVLAAQDYIGLSDDSVDELFRLGLTLA